MKSALLLLIITAPGRVLACAACYGQSDSALAEGMNMGVLFLLGGSHLAVALVNGRSAPARRTP